MITIHHERGNFWLRLKLFFTLGQCTQQTAMAKPAEPKQKRRSHRTTAYFDLP
jgi:hypothetical protein